MELGVGIGEVAKSTGFYVECMECIETRSAFGRAIGFTGMVRWLGRPARPLVETSRSG